MTRPAFHRLARTFARPLAALLTGFTVLIERRASAVTGHATLV